MSCLSLASGIKGTQIQSRFKQRAEPLAEQNKLTLFEQVVVPHLAAAYNLARWLVRNSEDAEDMVQEAYLRAFKSFDGFRGGESRAWLLTIVRNTCYTWLQQNRARELTMAFDEDVHTLEDNAPSPEALLLETANAKVLQQTLEELPLEFREAIILRGLEGMSYKEIADLTGVPLGTVMSRLARARDRLQRRFAQPVGKEP